MSDKPTQLYRHWDADGNLLYVGISLTYSQRLAQHRGCSNWFRDVANVTIEWFDDRKTALIAERNAIKFEKPRYNIIHNSVSLFEDFSAVDDFENTRDTITIRSVTFKPLYTVEEISSETGIHRNTVKALIDSGELGSVPHPHTRLGYKRYLVTGWQLIEYIEQISKSEKVSE